MRSYIAIAYRFSELSPKAKDYARYKYMEMWGYSRSDEYLASLKALAEHFDGRLEDYSITWDNSGYSSAKFSMPKDMKVAEIRRRLKLLGSFNRKTLAGHGDCKLTGWCYDESAIDGFRWAFIREGERDLNRLMQAAFKTWLKAAHADNEYDFSDEGFGETADANEWEFDDTGRILSREKQRRPQCPVWGHSQLERNGKLRRQFPNHIGNR